MYSCCLSHFIPVDSFNVEEEWIKEFEHLLYEFADSSTDRDGNVDMVGSSNFDIGSKSIKSFISHLREKDKERIIKIIQELRSPFLSPNITSEGSNLDRVYNQALEDIISKINNK